MRRISSKHARAGMVLSRPVYDNRGYMIFDSDIKLSDDALRMLDLYGIGEILVRDNRVNDVLVYPLIPSELEGQTALALRKLLMDTQSNGSIKPALLDQVKKPIFSMVRMLYPDVKGEPNTAGCNVLQDYDCVQPVNVACLSLLIGRRVGLPMMDLAHLGSASVLMNIGYGQLQHLSMHGWIPKKTEPLTENEFLEIRKHPEHGSRLLKKVGTVDAKITEAVYQHHERWNASGYPRGLEGAEISLFARIIAITDTYCTLISNRPFRRAYLPHEAMEFILRFSGELFDPDLVNIFSTEIPLYPTGVTVRLNTGEIGIVIKANPWSFGRPVIRVIYGEYGAPVRNLYDIDLNIAEHQHKQIVETLTY